MGFQNMSGIPGVVRTAAFVSNTNPLLQSRGIGGFAEPSALFGNGEQGAWWDFSDQNSMMQNYATAGNNTYCTGAPALESSIAFVADKRIPLSGKNELKDPTFLQGNSLWTLGPNSTVQGNQVVSINTPAFAYVINQNTALKANTWYFARFTVKKTSGAFAVNYGSTAIFTNINVDGTYGTYFNTGASANQLFNIIESAGGTLTANFSFDGIWEAPGNHLIQPTAGARPVLSKRFNFLTKTEKFSDAAWTKRGTATSVPSNVIGPNGATCELISGIDALGVNDLYQLINAVQAPAGTTTVPRIWIKKAAPGSSGVLRMLNPTNALNGEWRVDFTKLSDNFELININHPAVTVIAAFNTPAGNGSGMHFAAFSGGPLSFYATQADHRITADAALAMPEYQRVNTATDYDTIGFPAYLLFDGATKWMQSAAAIPFSGQQMTVIMGESNLVSGTTSLYSSGGNVDGGFYALKINTTFEPNVRGTVQQEWADYTGPAIPETSTLSVVHDMSQGSIAGRDVLYRNNIQLTGNPGAQSTTPGNFTPQTVYIGTNNGTAQFYNGRMFGLILRNAATNANDLSMTNKWMGSKCGLIF